MLSDGMLTGVPVIQIFVRSLGTSTSTYAVRASNVAQQSKLF
jgi:hypothetical protein